MKLSQISVERLMNEVITPGLKAALNKRDARIAELEGRIARLEKAMNGEQVAEWPIAERKVA